MARRLVRMIGGLVVVPLVASGLVGCGDRGEDLPAFADTGVQELVTAAVEGDRDRVLALVSEGVDVNHRAGGTEPQRVGLTPLHHVVESAPEEQVGVAIRILLDAGADPLLHLQPDVRPFPGNNVPHHAVARGRAPALHALLEARPSVADAPARTGGTLLHALAGAEGTAFDQVTKTALLRAGIEAGGDVDARDRATRATPLHAAAHVNDVEACLLLIRSGADAGIRDSTGETFLRYLMTTPDAVANDTLRGGRRDVLAELRARGFPTDY